jgi:putative DNA primase/helicase
MNLPFSLDDITSKKTRDDGTSYPQFDRTKAAKTILTKMQLAIEIFDSREDQAEIWHYDGGVWHPGGQQLISHFLDKVAENLSNSENISDVLRRIRGELRLDPVEFDITNPYLVGCKNGRTLDLQTGKDRKAAPMDLISMPIPVQYDPNAKCPEFIKFMEGITATDDDRVSIIDFLASLLICEPLDFFVAAPGLGSNGRSKFKDFIRAFIGSDTCRSIPLKNLNDRFTAGFLTRTRVNFCNETEVSAVALDFIKRCSEKMPAEQKFKGMANALLILKFFFDTNTMPAIADISYGAERRICRWDLPWRFVDNPNPDAPMEKQRDPDIIAKITTDEELSGVLNMILERAPEVIRQRMIHHRTGGLQEYALQSRSGDVFLELFLSATNNDAERVHTNTIRTAYQRYCTVTNSSLLGPKSMKTIIEDRLGRHMESNVKIDKVNRSGYKSLKYDSELFDGTILILEKARAEGKPVFQTLLTAFPDLENSTNSAKFYQTLPNSTTENTISILYGRIVEKYRVEKPGRNVKAERIEQIPPENLASKNSTFSTFLPTKVNDSGNGGRVLVELVENGREDTVVKEFLRDGGQSSLQRFLAEFPEAAE